MLNMKIDTWEYPLTNWFNHLLVNKEYQIEVKGFSHEELVTVQVFEDGILTHCNHAGHQTEGVDKYYYTPEIDREYTQIMEVCDKYNCSAASFDGIDWSE